MSTVGFLASSRAIGCPGAYMCSRARSVVSTQRSASPRTPAASAASRNPPGVAYLGARSGLTYKHGGVRAAPAEVEGTAFILPDNTTRVLSAHSSKTSPTMVRPAGGRHEPGRRRGLGRA